MQSMSWAPTLTRDADIAAASVPVLPKAQVLLDLWDYARNSAVRVAVVLGTTTAVMIPIRPTCAGHQIALVQAQ